jgi:CDGSH iron-sulfur domain-containing protein 2
VPPTAAVAGVVYMSYLAFCPEARPKFMVNLKIGKDKEKVVDMVDIEDIGEKAAYCRCWKSKTVSTFIWIISQKTLF